MVTPFFGLAALAYVLYHVLTPSAHVEQLSFLSFHAAVVVVGGVLGALFVAVDRISLWRMVLSLGEFVPSQKRSPSLQNRVFHGGLHQLKVLWLEGERSKILQMSDQHPHEIVRLACELVVTQASLTTIEQTFTERKITQQRFYSPLVEGWDLISKLAPSFGMVGTVSGMVQLFQNMSTDIKGLGGAMAMALLATLYGISLGALLGGPMSSRVYSKLNEELDWLDLSESVVKGLLYGHAEPQGV